MEMLEQTAFQIDLRDNVATALCALTPGPIRLLGEPITDALTAAIDVPVGHKLALRAIAAGETIVKYGVPIGRATQDIPEGGWVHLHVMESIYDERSSHLDVETGAPKDTLYE